MWTAQSTEHVLSTHPHSPNQSIDQMQASGWTRGMTNLPISEISSKMKAERKINSKVIPQDVV
jgi:hypothetical protein